MAVSEEQGLEALPMKITSMLLWLLVLAAIPCGNACADSLDCKGGIVSVGDSRVNLLIKCGDPDWKDSHDEELIEHLDNRSRNKIIITVDEWTYNFGPAQLIRIVTLKNGQIAAIRTNGYGNDNATKPGKRDCGGQIVSIGDLKSDILSKCGEPSWKDIHQEETRERLDRGFQQKVYTTIEEWTYNWGPSRFVRILTFRNNKLVDIKTGGYGYDLIQDDTRKAP
jgi:hypothetical protein